MFFARVTSRLSKTVFDQYRSSSLLHARQRQHLFPILSSGFHSLGDPQIKVVSVESRPISGSILNTCFQYNQFFSTATPQTNEKEAAQYQNGQQSEAERKSAPKKENANTKEETSESEDDAENGLTKEELVKLVMEKEALLKKSKKEFDQSKDKLLRSYAELQNVMERTKREAENSKKFAIQNFAKSLLDVADNLGRASSVVKESFSKVDSSEDPTGAVPLLKTLLQGVEMTEKELAEVFKKFGMERYNPADEQFDPHRHNAIFQVPDPKKPAGTVAVVLKPGYTLHDRVLRPAEVGVVVAVDTTKEDENSKT